MKLDRLALEIVRLGAEDVIATSGGSVPTNPYADLNGWYITPRSEADEGKMDYSNIIVDGSHVAFWVDHGVFEGSDKAVGDDYEVNHYAWYDAGQWHTDSKPMADYGSLPTTGEGSWKWWE